MNDVRRKHINEIMSTLAALRSQIEDLKDEEQDCFDNLPESFQ